MLNNSAHGTTWYNTGNGFINNWGQGMDYLGTSTTNDSSVQSSSHGVASSFSNILGGGAGNNGTPDFSKFNFAQYSDISPQLAGLYAHRTMASFFKDNPRLRGNWIPEQKSSIWKWDMSWRPDLRYKNNGVNAMWELKPISQFIASSLSGKDQVKFYADMETYISKEKFDVGFSKGAPIPPINGQTLMDVSGYEFSYIVPMGSDGMIYYQCLNCDKLRRSPVHDTQPQTVDETATALTIAVVVFKYISKINT